MRGGGGWGMLYVLRGMTSHYTPVCFLCLRMICNQVMGWCA